MTQLHVGEIIGGAIDSLIGALINKEITKNIPEVGFGDFIEIPTDEFDIIGMVSYMKFETYGQVQPLGLPPTERRAILPDIEDVVNANTRKIISIPVLGYIQDDQVHQDIPPHLPNIHDPIIPLNDKLAKKFHTPLKETKVDPRRGRDWCLLTNSLQRILPMVIYDLGSRMMLALEAVASHPWCVREPTNAALSCSCIAPLSRLAFL